LVFGPQTNYGRNPIESGTCMATIGNGTFDKIEGKIEMKQQKEGKQKRSDIKVVSVAKV